MPLIIGGVSHKTCPLELREALAARNRGEIVVELSRLGLEESVVLSTCNRFEIYANAPHTPGAIVDRLRSWAGGAVEPYVYQFTGEAAIRHLFSVSSGLESLVVGEAEILGQVKQAYEQAKASGTTGKLTNVLFQRALHVGKLVRTRTGISTGQLSVASVAVALAQRIFGSLKESSVMILGAGAMAETMAKHLLSGKVRQVFLANRTYEKAVELAERYGARPIKWEDFPGQLSAVDIVMTSTGSTEPIITRDMVRKAVGQRAGRSLFVIDIAMPRDVDDSVHDIDHVYLYSMQDLQGIVDENLERRKAEIESAAALVSRKSAEFARWLASFESGALAALRHSPGGGVLPETT